MRNNLACFGGYPTHLDVVDMSNLFYFHMIKEDDALTEISPFKAEGMDKNRYNHFRQPGLIKIIRMRMYQFKLTKS